MSRQLELVKELLIDQDHGSLSDDAKKALAHSIHQHNLTFAENRISDQSRLHQSYGDDSMAMLQDSQYDDSCDDLLDETTSVVNERRKSKRVHPSAPCLNPPVSTTEVDTSEDDYGKNLHILSFLIYTFL